VFVGLAVFAAIGTLSHEHERAFSGSIVYLLFGLGAAAGLAMLGVDWVEPLEDADVIARAAEAAVVMALFATGLQLDRELDLRAWGSVARLLAIVMPLTIVAVAALASWALGLSLGAAVLLGAALAPTDPVLAGDVGVGPPGEEDEREPNFSITAEAGLNDGLAFPFVLLGLGLATHEGDGWLLEWALADVAYAIVAGLAVGGCLGYAIAAIAVRLRERELLSADLDWWLPIAAVLVIYGTSEALATYGFLAAFAGGLAFRRYERDHEVNRRVHEGAELTQNFLELGFILLLGSVVTADGLAAPGAGGWAVAVVLILVVRPLAVTLAFVRSPMPPRERAFVGWFGVRGIGSLYYVAFALAAGALAPDEAELVLWTTVACVVVSILLHGVTGGPFQKRLPVAGER
jgi:sodium/hydrogen antiporter